MPISLAQIWREEETYSAFADAFAELQTVVRGENGSQTELITIPAELVDLVILSLARTPNLYSVSPQTRGWIHSQSRRIERRGSRPPQPINVPLWIAADVLLGACNPGFTPAVNDWAAAAIQSLKLSPLARDRFQTIMGRSAAYCRCRLCRGGSQ